MRYLIIGLGIYGSNLAIDLTNMGHDVIGADKTPSLVEAIKDNISTAYIIDSTDEESLGMLPLKNVDLVIVAIGEDFGASIKTVALLKKLGVKHIFARAVDSLHESILEGFNVDRILNPEQRAASDLVNEMSLGFNVESMSVDDDVSIVKFRAPQVFVGQLYARLDLEKEYGLRLLSAGRAVKKNNILGLTHDEYSLIDFDESPDAVVEAGDMMVCMGAKKAFSKLFRRLSESLL